MLRYCALLSLFVGLFAFAAPTPVYAQDDAPETTEETTDDGSEGEDTPEGEEEEKVEADLSPEQQLDYTINNLIMFFCAILVLFMQAGFAMVESGFNAAKNTVNILAKNVMDLCVGVLLYFLVGFGLMYPGEEFKGGYFGFGSVGITPGDVDSFAIPSKPDDLEPGASDEEKKEYEEALATYNEEFPVWEEKYGESVNGSYHPQVDFLFQVAFAATAATIVSGAVAGRMKFSAYLVYSAILTGLVYPISGMWKWGGGWLAEMKFDDFAGSLVVHALGGFAGLAGAIVLGPRIGRFSEDGKSQPMPGHNLSIATLGVFILLVGWFGFNPGSQLTFNGTGNSIATVFIATNTLLAAAGGGLAAIVFAWVLFKKPDLSMALNGLLGGLVGITANCNLVSSWESIIIGLVAGVLVVLGVMLLDKLKIDDPVGAWPVHGLCGIWGGLACAIFGGSPWVAQIVGSIAIPVWGFVTMFILFTILKGAGLLRVSAEDETKGLDISEHGMHAYLNS